MELDRPLRVGITCYPSIGGSGIVASTLGAELARRGHDVHFISYERPFRLPHDLPRVHFHPVGINAYGLFKYPDYTLPLSVKMAEVSRELPARPAARPLCRAPCNGRRAGAVDAAARAEAEDRHHLARHRHHVAGPRPRLRARDPPRSGVLRRGHGRIRVPPRRDPARAQCRSAHRRGTQLLRAQARRTRPATKYGTSWVSLTRWSYCTARTFAP